MLGNKTPLYRIHADGSRNPLEIERRRAAEEQLHVENRMWDELQHVARTRGFRARLPRAVLLGLDEV